MTATSTLYAQICTGGGSNGYPPMSVQKLANKSSKMLSWLDEKGSPLNCIFEVPSPPF